MKQVKCALCGGETSSHEIVLKIGYTKEISLPGRARFEEPINAHEVAVCNDCGYIHFFMSQEMVNRTSGR